MDRFSFVIQYVDILRRVVSGDVKFAFYIQVDRFFGVRGQLLDRLFVAGQPVVGFKALGRFSRPADELIVIGILIWMQLNAWDDPRQEQRKDEALLEARSV